MKKLLYPFAGAILAFMVVGCADKSPRLVGADMPQSNIVFEDSGVEKWFTLENAVMLKRADNMTEIELVGKNRSSSTQTMTYKIDWLDDNGFIIKSILNTRKIASVEAGRNIIIHAISPSVKAVSYKIRIGAPIEQDELRDKNVNVRQYQGE